VEIITKGLRIRFTGGKINHCHGECRSLKNLWFSYITCIQWRILLYSSFPDRLLKQKRKHRLQLQNNSVIPGRYMWD